MTYLYLGQWTEVICDVNVEYVGPSLAELPLVEPDFTAAHVSIFAAVQDDVHFG